VRLRRSTSIAAFTALTVSLLTAPAFAGTPGATTLYVDNTGTSCTDTGSGAAAAPFCTIQAAADVVSAGQSVHILGTYSEAVTIRRSGTAARPITFVADNSNFSILQAPAGAATLTVRGARNVVIRNLSIWGATGQDAVDITGSSRITVDSDRISGNTSGNAVHVTGRSSHVTVSRDQIGQSSGPGVRIDAGGAHDTVTTDDFYGGASPAVAVDGTADAAVTSNTVRYACNQAIRVTGASAGSSVENNVVQNLLSATVTFGCPATTEPVAGLVVDSAAAPGVTADYNTVYPYFAEPAYDWAGTAYTGATDLFNAVGQGAHDLNTSPQLNPNYYYSVPDEGSSVIDSANSGAPGELSSDVYGFPRLDDPLTPNTGGGAHSYYDRGAYEMQDSFSLPLTASAQQAPVGGLVTFSGSFGDSWNETLGISYDFGDGSPRVTGAAAVTHAFAAPGRYAVTATLTDTSGLTASTYVYVTVVAAAPLTPALTLTPYPASGAVVADASASTDAWNITDYKWDFGDGLTADSYGSPTAYHYYAAAGTYTVKLTITDAGGNTATISAAVTAS